MAESIDPNSISRGEPPHEPAEQAGLPKSHWEVEMEIPRRLVNSPAPAGWHGWWTVAPTLGTAFVVLAAGGIIAWRDPNPQNFAESRLDQPSTRAGTRSAIANLPDESTRIEVAQAPPSPDLGAQPRPPAVTPSSDAASESQANTAELAPSESGPPVDDNRPRTTGPRTEVISATTSPLSRYRLAINRVRAAFVAGDLKRAQQQLELAAQFAESPGQKDQIARFRALGAQLDRFWAAVRAGLKALEPAEELHVDHAIAAVIESGPESLALFVAGSRRDYTLANLPAKVALLVAQRGADEDAPANQVFFGAFQAVHPRGNLDRARQLWESAAAAGEPVSDLLPFLDSKAMAIEREPIPDSRQLAAAEAAIEKKFADTIESAKTAQRKSQLAASLRSAASDAQTSLDQYALLKQATRWAIAAAEFPSALRAIDQQARWFEVDAWTLKSEALAEAMAASPTTASAKQIAMSALELSDAAEAQGSSEQAQALAITAQAAAGKARDRELIKKAAQRRRDVEKPEKRPGKAPAASE